MHDTDSWNFHKQILALHWFVLFPHTKVFSDYTFFYIKYTICQQNHVFYNPLYLIYAI